MWLHHDVFWIPYSFIYSFYCRAWQRVCWTTTWTVSCHFVPNISWYDLFIYFHPIYYATHWIFAYSIQPEEEHPKSQNSNHQGKTWDFEADIHIVWIFILFFHLMLLVHLWLQVLEAITTKKCQDQFHLESLETLGDSFLKYAVCQQLFQHSHTHHEGLLSTKKDVMVSNVMLCKFGCQQKLQVNILQS